MLRLPLPACLRAIGVVFVVSMGATGCSTGESAGDELHRAAAYLWRAQRDDGAWRSDVHGLARSGQSWTPFVLFHLLTAPADDEESHDAAVRRAFDFIAMHTLAVSDSASALGFADPNAVDYPVYATAYALRAYLIGRERGLLTPREADLIPRMAAYLLEQQHTQARGVQDDDPAFGGWGMGTRRFRPDDAPVASPTPYADVAHTRRVLEALTDVEPYAPPLRNRILAARTAALRFLQRAQKSDLPEFDGGFFYSPVILDLNKGGRSGGDGGHPLSYATATSDGLLALLAARLDTAEPAVRAAQGYLAMHDTLEYAAGLPSERAVWREVLFFYHLAARTEVHRRVGSGGGWRDEVAALLRARQRADGSFMNPMGAPNKEDDPIIATTLALGAMSAARATL